MVTLLVLTGARVISVLIGPLGRSTGTHSHGRAPVTLPHASSPPSRVHFEHLLRTDSPPSHRAFSGVVPRLHTSATPLMVAQCCAAQSGDDFNPEVVPFLKGISVVSQQPGKRQRSSVSVYDRAVSLGIGHRLRVSLLCCWHALKVDHMQIRLQQRRSFTASKGQIRRQLHGPRRTS